jgi:hypothetical protein
MSVIHLNAQEFNQVVRVATCFWESAEPVDKPEARIFIGGVGSGKTTLRRKFRGRGYVQLELSDILGVLEPAFSREHPKLADYTVVAVEMIIQESFSKQRNVALEMLGDDQAVLHALLEGLLTVGYRPDLQYIHCEFAQAVARHRLATAAEPEYISCFYAEIPVLRELFKYLCLDIAPVLALERRREESDQTRNN